MRVSGKEIEPDDVRTCFINSQSDPAQGYGRGAMKTIELNLAAAWIGILLGFVSGLLLGLFFHREDWLGGYGSFKRRLYRLAHISFFGLGAVNLLFYFTVRDFVMSDRLVQLASATFLIGAVTMPLCCVLMAHFPKARMSFAVPVLTLIAGGMLTLGVIVQEARISLDPQPITLNSK